jgi:hypothetical protein
MNVNTSETPQNQKKGYACYPFQIGDSQAWPPPREITFIYGHIASRPRRWSGSFPNSRGFHIRRNHEAGSTVLETKKMLVSNELDQRFGVK